MKTSTVFRMTAWASFGVLIALAWGFYFAGVEKALPVAPNVRWLAGLTQPGVAAIQSFDSGARIGLCGAALLNAATYALFGLFVETIRRPCRRTVTG